MKSEESLCQPWPTRMDVLGGQMCLCQVFILHRPERKSPLKSHLFRINWALLEKSLVGKESCWKRVFWPWQSLKVRYGIPYLKLLEPDVCRVLQFGEAWLPCMLGCCIQGTIDLKLRTTLTLPATSHPATIRLGPNAESMNMQRGQTSECACEKNLWPDATHIYTHAHAWTVHYLMHFRPYVCECGWESWI